MKVSITFHGFITIDIFFQMHICSSGLSPIVSVLSCWACGPRFSHLTSGTPCTVRRKQSLPEMIQTFMKVTLWKRLSSCTGYTQSLKQPSKLSVPREDKPTQESFLGNPILETPQLERKISFKDEPNGLLRGQSTLCHVVWDVRPSLHRWKDKEITLAISHWNYCACLKSMIGCWTFSLLPVQVWTVLAHCSDVAQGKLAAISTLAC